MSPRGTLRETPPSRRGEPGAAVAIAAAERLARTAGAKLSHTATPVAARSLQTIYAHRARNPRHRAAVARQCDRLAQIAEQFPDERWHIYIGAIDDQPEVTVFSNALGIGRACIDYVLGGARDQRRHVGMRSYVRIRQA